MITALTVDDRGLRFSVRGDEPVDVCFDGVRVFSLWTERDTEPVSGGRSYPWPGVLRRFLHGRTTVSLVRPEGAPGGGEVLASAAATLGDGDGVVSVTDAEGNPMGLDKSLRLTRLFGSRDPAQLTPLLDAMETVIEALEAAGLEPFLAYGTLLGAVRDQDFIGHDSDADLGYVSAYEHPTDAMLESYRVQRQVERMGFRIQRYSGLAFKILVEEGDGTSRGLDVFGGFLRRESAESGSGHTEDGGTLYLMGEVGHPFRSESLTPRATATLAGRTFPVPADPEPLLEAMYGPGWRVPDPAYQFTTPLSTRRRLNGWFRGMRVGFDDRWTRVRAGEEPIRHEPSGLVRWMRRDLPEGATVIDAGCGRGRDCIWLGHRGVRTVGVDYFPNDFLPRVRRARVQEIPVEFAWVNFCDLRSVMPAVAELSRLPGPRSVMGRHLLDATDAHGREHLLRAARVLTRGGGKLYLQFQTVATEISARMGVHPLDPAAVTAQIVEAGGRVEQMVELDEHEDGAFDVGPSGVPTICRMMVSWTR